MEERNVDKLSGWIMKLAVVAVICAACWYFRSVLVYVLAAFVVSLRGQPIMQLFRKIKIKGKSLPDAFLAVVTILVILLAVPLLVTQLITVVVHIVRDASAMNAQDVPYNSLLDQVDEWLSDPDLRTSFAERRQRMPFSSGTSCLSRSAMRRSTSSPQARP